MAFLQAHVSDRDTPHFALTGDPGRVLRPVCPDRRVQPADEERRQQRAGATAEEAGRPEGLDDGGAGLPCGSGERLCVCVGAGGALLTCAVVSSGAVRGLHLLESLPVRP